MDNIKKTLDEYLLSQFSRKEWNDLMDHIHVPVSSCSPETNELKRKYWRLKKAQSRLLRRRRRMADPGFIDWLERRGLPTNKYRHTYWRNYMIDKGEE